MRTTFSSLAVMASSLLVREVLAAPHGHAHANIHAKRDYYLDTDSVIVTEEVWITELPDGSYATAAPVAVGTITIDGSAVLVTEPVTSSTAAPIEAPAPTEIPSTTEILPTPTPTPSTSTSSTPIPEPTTSSTLAAVFIEAKESTTPVYVAPTTSEEPVVIPTTLATSVYVPPTTTSAAPVATTAPVSSTNKRGLAYNDASLLAAFTGYSEISWAYNWGSTTSGSMPSGVEYIPMLWGMTSGDLSNWDEAASTAIAAGTTHLLAFNEPDHSEQANLAYADAAAGYLQYMQPYAGQAKLISPAVTNGGDPMGLTWLSNFMGACSSCTIDAVAIHWYNGGDAAAFKEYMAKAYTAGGNRPLWITEFQAAGTTEEQTAFLTEVMAWMDETDYIERYSYFMVSDGNLVSGTSLSALGSTYATS